MIKLNSLITVIILGVAVASPVPAGKDADGRVLYDQRQQGELNVRADLKNFVILIIPTTVPNSSSPAASLLDLFSKTLPSRPHVKRVKPVKAPAADAAEETQHFIESKTAPYHVDITEAKEHLTTLHPAAEEIVLAPAASSRVTRSSRPRAFVLTVPTEEFTVSKTEDSKNIVKKDGKKVHKETPQKTLVLLGAELEQCGPGRARDSGGVCRFVDDQGFLTD